MLKGDETADRDFNPSSGVAAIKKEISISKQKWTRREILGAGATAVAAPYVVPASALGLDGSPPPSETVKVGIAGLGGRARWILEKLSN
ncbi:MAG: hypothetical protein OSA89_18340 [Mariniblastus sp.]|nr:hypothetical protein [Mariniblastus sp.]